MRVDLTGDFTQSKMQHHILPSKKALEYRFRKISSNGNDRMF